ncbi:hypothetical protein E2C01_094039 [Portunus trituberculatus]|uniref:Uncharacterized protein n=1 Tax=Portunus trituberculatus TaxID=210409 RepID=A0A5B7JPD2_PORTR|nr:hypothetical protein [Portunus trituberculatus]
MGSNPGHGLKLGKASTQDNGSHMLKLKPIAMRHHPNPKTIGKPDVKTSKKLN